MATFSKDEQQQFRKEFIKEGKLKAWGAACNASYVIKGVNELDVELGRITEQDTGLADEIKAMENALDAHMVDNRQKRKALQEKRNTLKRVMEGIGRQIAEGQRALNSLRTSIETNLALVAYAEEYEWKEVETAPPVTESNDTGGEAAAVA